MSTPKGRLCACAFTLIELLIVISVIGLLVGILLPALSAARQTGQAGVCMHNMQQIGMSVHLYADANEDALVALTQTPTGFVHWIELLRPYLQRPELCRCPNDRSRKWEPDPFEVRLGRRTTSYVSNNRMTPGLGIVKRGQVRAPSEKIMFAEFKDDAIGDHFHPESWPLFLSKPENELAMTRHRGLANYWFVDGHAERLRFEQTWQISGSPDRYNPLR